MGIINAFPEKQEQITVDTSLSTTSTNPVQNKVITGALNNKADKTYVDNTVNSKVLYSINTSTSLSDDLSITAPFEIGGIYNLKLSGYASGSNVTIRFTPNSGSEYRILYNDNDSSTPFTGKYGTGSAYVACFDDTDTHFCLDINFHISQESSSVYTRYNSQFGGYGRGSIGIASGYLYGSSVPTKMYIDLGLTGTISSLVLTKVN